MDIETDSLNRVYRVKDSALSANWRSYTHDARGNVTQDGIHGFSYDFANQPTAISGADTGSYSYDGNLRRVKQVVGGQTLYSIYDRSGALLSRDNATSASKTDYLALAGQTFVRVKNNVASYPLNDHLGTALAVAAQNGSIPAAQTYTTTPFGEAYGAYNPGDTNEQGYTGHIEDATGLTYMQARYYDPAIGRFLSTDPVGYLDQLNVYAYVANDPVNSIDPTGRYGRGSGWTDEQWKKFDKVQQKAAGRMENRASKMEAKAERLDAKGKPGGDALRAKAGHLNAGASALRSNGSDGKIANAVGSAIYQSMGGSASGAAFVRGNGPVMTVNVDNKDAWNSGSRMSGHAVGHESLHTAGLNDQRGSNGALAHKYGIEQQREAFEELKGTPTGDINPDHLMDEVY